MNRLLVASLFALTSSQTLAMDSLSDLGLNNRVFLVFGNVDDQKVAHQLKVLETQKGELEERNIVVIRVSREKATAVYGNALPSTVPNSDKMPISRTMVFMSFWWAGMAEQSFTARR